MQIKGGALVKTITSVELAKLADVSQSTVSRCLNDSPLVSSKTKARVKKIAEQYAFQFNTNARGLRTNRTGVVGYIFSEDFSGFTNHYIQSDLYYRIRMRLLEYGMDLVPVFDDLVEGGASSIEKSVGSRRYDALIFNRQSVSGRVRTLLEETHIPYIFIYDTDESSEEPYLIAPRHTKIGYLAGKSFCEAGYRNFVELTGPSRRIDVVNKHAGFSEALAAYGLAVPEDHVLCANYQLETAEQVTLEHIDLFSPGTAVFAQNDMVALGTLEALKRSGLRVPEDVALIGVDNVVMGCWFHPQLTTVAIDYDQIIDLTAKWVLQVTTDQMPESYRRFLDETLILRDTFVPVKK